MGILHKLLIANAIFQGPDLTGALTFKRAAGETETATISLTQNRTLSGTNIYYRTQDQDWTAYTFGTTLNLTSDDDYVQFWNKTKTLSTSVSTYARFVMTRKN